MLEQVGTKRKNNSTSKTNKTTQGHRPELQTKKISIGKDNTDKPRHSKTTKMSISK